MASNAEDQGPFKKEGDKGHPDFKRHLKSKTKVPSIKKAIKVMTTLKRLLKPKAKVPSKKVIKVMATLSKLGEKDQGLTVKKTKVLTILECWHHKIHNNKTSKDRDRKNIVGYVKLASQVEIVNIKN
jgi:hypothetical protein